MKYTRKEYEDKLLTGLTHAKFSGEVSKNLKTLFYDLATDISMNKKRYPYYSNELRIRMAHEACEACVKHMFKFNVTRGEAFPYFSVIIRSDIARISKKEYNKKIN